MIRKILALIAGLLTFWVVATLIQLLNVLIFGMPSQETLRDPEKMTAYVASMPVGGFVVLLVGYMIGSFASGFVARNISRWDSPVLPLIIGLVFTVAWVVNVASIPHPMWVTIVGFFCYIPFTLLGHRLASRP